MRHRTGGAVRRAELAAAICLLALVPVACSKPSPRSFGEFMQDRVLMEGVLARCNQQRDETRDDIECANARRAAMAIALEQERAEREQLARESEQKIRALRAELDRRVRAAREAQAAKETDPLKVPWNERTAEPGAPAGASSAAPGGSAPVAESPAPALPTTDPLAPADSVATHGAIAEPVPPAGGDLPPPLKPGGTQ